VATAYRHGWVRAVEELGSTARRVRRLVIGAQVTAGAAFAIAGLAALPTPTGWQLVLLAAATGWSAYVTDTLARRRRPVEHCCMAQLPTALVALLAGVAGPHGSAPAAVAVLLLLVLGAAPYVERVHLIVLGAAGGAGALAVLGAADPGRFPVSWLGVLAVLGTGVGLARQSRGHERMLRELVELEATDAVTGLPNARYLRQAVQEAHDAADARRPLALVAVEIDGYRDLDHAHGFRVADDVLAGVAERLRAVLPPDATLARGEGETLVAVLPGADTGVAREVAHALHAAADRRPPEPDRKPDRKPDPLPAVRLAVGIAVHPSPEVLERPAASGAALLARAERALRDSLRTGDPVRISAAPDRGVARPAYD
jgi:diguanylate cyclase (GGDEF)-like protein